MAVPVSHAASASHLGERPGSFSWWSLRQEFTPSPTRVRSAIKFALGSTLVMVLAFQFNWPAAVAMCPSLFLTRADARFDLPQGLVAAFATWVAGAFYYWALNFSQNLPLFALVLGGGLVVFGALATLPQIGAPVNIGMISCAALLTEYFFRSDARGPLFLPTTSILLLGYAVALVLPYTLWPYSPRQQWDESSIGIWTGCRRACARWFAGESAPPRPDELDRLAKEILGLSGQRIQPTDPADPGVAIRTTAAHRIQEVIILLHDLGRLGQGRQAMDDPASWRQLGEDFDQRFAVLGSVLAKRGRAPDLDGDHPLLDGRAGETSSAGDDLLRRENLRRLWATLNECAGVFLDVARLQKVESVTQRNQTLRWVPALRLADLRQLGTAKPWKGGVKVALLILVCLLFWQAFRWPNGSTVLSTALIVNLPDVGSSARRSITRVLGLLLGMLLALLCTVLVVRYVETVVGYGLCVFLVLTGCGYLCGASSRVAYAGFQASVTFVLTFIGDDQQSVSLEALRGRFVGIVAGVVIAETILHSVWPVRRVRDMFKGLADNFALCARAWTGLFQAKPEEFPARQEEFIKQYNKGFVGNVALNDSLEFESGAGSARYGYTSRLLVHESALFEQMRLVGVDWAHLVRDGEGLPAEFDTIRQRFATLAERLGQPVDLPPFPTGSHHLTPMVSDSQHRRILQQRFRQVESILASMDRLTALPSTA